MSDELKPFVTNVTYNNQTFKISYGNEKLEIICLEKSYLFFEAVSGFDTHTINNGKRIPRKKFVETLYQFASNKCEYINFDFEIEKRNTICADNEFIRLTLIMNVKDALGIEPEK